MISDTLQEQASLYALGILPAADGPAFEKELASNEELRRLVNSLRIAADGLAYALPPVAPPSSSRARLLTPINITPFPASAPARSWWLGKAAAAVIAVGVPTGLAIHFYNNQKASETARLAAEEETAAIKNVRDRLLKENSSLTTEALAARQEAKDSAGRAANLETAMAELGTTNKALAQEVSILRKRGAYDQARIALLGATKKAPGANAVSIWDQDAQSGVLVVEKLPELPSGKNYPLWVLDGELPVSAGLLEVDAKGGGRITFKTRANVKTASLFAVTIEPKGEQAAPTLAEMVLAGK